MTNRKFAETNEDFLKACEDVKCINQFQDFKPSTRQASRWRNRKGIAWKIAHNQYK